MIVVAEYGVISRDLGPIAPSTLKQQQCCMATSRPAPASLDICRASRRPLFFSGLIVGGDACF